MTENIPLVERITATFIRALNPDCFLHYGYKRLPSAPANFDTDMNKCSQIKSDSDRVSAYRELKAKYAGYFEARSKAEYENASNMTFLKEMMEHFKSVGLLTHAEVCKNKLYEYGV